MGFLEVFDRAHIYICAYVPIKFPEGHRHPTLLSMLTYTHANHDKELPHMTFQWAARGLMPASQVVGYGVPG